MNKKQKLIVKPTSAMEIVISIPKEEEMKTQIPLTKVDDILIDFSFDTDNQGEITPSDNVIKAMDDKHAWAIFLDPKLIQRVEEAGVIQNFLIGYENGLKARQNETHFSQKENDPINHRLIFQPEPTFISYSFFYGFFGKTIENMCEAYASQNTEFNISGRKQILASFCEKYTFSFPKNPELTGVMYEYAEILIENIIDIQAKVGE
jgi:hypothetical protein